MPAPQSFKMRKPTLDTMNGKRGPKPKFPDPDVMAKAVRGFAKMGTPIKEIAEHLSCSVKYLKENFAKDLACGREIANALVSENLYQQAMKDNPASINAAIYITKAKMGWADKKDDASRAPPQVVFNFGDMTYEERLHLMNKIKVQLGQEPVHMIETDYEEIEGEDQPNE